MKVLPIFLLFGVSLVNSAPSPQSPFGSGAFQVSSFIGPSTRPGYYVHNYLQIDQNRGYPIGIFSDGRPGIAAIPPNYNYLGTPVYDYRYHFNHIYPGFPGGFQLFGFPEAVPVEPPSLVPAGESPIYPPPIYRPPNYQPPKPQPPNYQPPTTQRPFDEDDGIEKLDEKFDPNMQNFNGGSGTHPNDDNDSVTIDAA